jgi:hypothetical protein
MADARCRHDLIMGDETWYVRGVRGSGKILSLVGSAIAPLQSHTALSNFCGRPSNGRLNVRLRPKSGHSHRRPGTPRVLIHCKMCNRGLRCGEPLEAGGTSPTQAHMRDTKCHGENSRIWVPKRCPCFAVLCFPDTLPHDRFPRA